MKLVLDLDLACPVSGIVIQGGKIPYHTLPVQVLDNGTIMVFCPHHLVRVFVGDKITCRSIVESSKIIERIDKKKEAKHGTTS